MGFFDQMRAAQDMMKNMSPDQLKQMMEQAKEAQAMLKTQVQQILEEEIKNRGLVTRDEVRRMIEESKS